MSIQVKNLTIGEGVPKICVPITGTTKDEILDQAKEISNHPFDLVEFRADFYEDVFNFENTIDVLKELREIITDAPILFTFRTENEGGQKYISTADYMNLYMAICEAQVVDLVDVEIFMAEAAIKVIIDIAHTYNIKVLASNHDFNKTPEVSNIIYRLDKMNEFGADILKVAFMPTSKEDVVTLLHASVTADELFKDKAIVTISMGQLGLISRVCGQFSGSAITFGTVGEASAPGQLDAETLSNILDVVNVNKYEGLTS